MPLTTCCSARDLAGRWFLESGIQEASGGVARYYRSDLGRNNRVSTELTGYAASTLVWLHAVTADGRYLEAALRAGRFLTETAWDGAAGMFPFEHAMNGDAAAPLSYFFDNCIIIRGLLALSRATGDSRFALIAESCGASMARAFAGGGAFHPVIDLGSRRPEAGDARWSRNPGCYQLKAALAFLELFQETGRPEFEDVYERVLAYALATQRSFLPEPAEPAVMDRLHAYCYFLEGLLPCVERPACAAALCGGIERAGRLLEEIAPVFERSDVRGQLLRVRLYADRLGAAPLDRAAADRDFRRMLDFQLRDADARIHGGFCFGRRGSGLLPFVNPASTAFCVQAVEMWRAYQAGEFEPAWRILI